LKQNQIELKISRRFKFLPNEYYYFLFYEILFLINATLKKNHFSKKIQLDVPLICRKLQYFNV
jgi:hypothetical protein